MALKSNWRLGNIKVKNITEQVLGGGVTVDSGTFTVNDALTIKGSMTFGDAAADTLTVTGAMTTSADVTFNLGSTEAFTLTCDDISAPLVMTNTITTAGKTGARALFYTKFNVAVGAWINALKGYTEITGTSGYTSGLASAVVAEMKFAAKAGLSGAYYPLEIEVVCPATFSINGDGGSNAGFIYARASGTTTNWEDEAWFMRVVDLTAASGNMLSVNSQTLRCAFGTQGTPVERYMVFSHAEGVLSLGTFDAPITLLNSEYDASGNAYTITKAMISGLVDSTIETGYAIRQLWSRLKITTDQDSTKNAHFYGACLQARIHTGSAAVAIDDGTYAGTWNYLENSDSGANLTVGGGYFYGSRNMIELISTAVVNGGTFAGAEFTNHVDCSMASAIKFDAIYINKISGAQDWTIGVDINDSTTGINMGACTTGINFSGTTTACLLVSGTATYFADFDNATTCAITTESGAAATIKGNILVKTVAGATGYINVYGTVGT